MFKTVLRVLNSIFQVSFDPMVINSHHINGNKPLIRLALKWYLLCFAETSNPSQVGPNSSSPHRPHNSPTYPQVGIPVTTTHPNGTMAAAGAGEGARTEGGTGTKTGREKTNSNRTMWWGRHQRQIFPVQIQDPSGTSISRRRHRQLTSTQDTTTTYRCEVQKS